MTRRRSFLPSRNVQRALDHLIVAPSGRICPVCGAAASLVREDKDGVTATCFACKIQWGVSFVRRDLLSRGS